MRRTASFRAACARIAVAGVCALPASCGTDTAPPVSGPIIAGNSVQGTVRSGQQAVSGAKMTLYAAGVTGAAATDLLAGAAVTTDASGAFMANGYTCPTAATQVYVVARGGKTAQSGGNNAALVLLAALGNCGDLPAQATVAINEATTVASAWALAQFLAPGAQVLASATNTAGLQHAFQAAANLVNVTSGTAPGTALPMGAVAETAKLYSLANALAGCAGSNGGAACTPLFSASTLSGSVPSNTLDAALNIVRNPALQVVAVYNAIGGAIGGAGPFQPSLTAAPNDWTMSVTYGGCAAGCGGLNLPGNVAIDSTGSVWVPNYGGGVVSKFLSTGAAAAPQGYSGTGLNQSYGVTVDPRDNVWVGNENSVRGANNSRLGSISEFSPSGTELSGYGFTGGGVYYPQGIASDASGRIWVADYGDSSASLLATDGTAISGANGYGYSMLPFTPAVAVDASGNAWFAAQQVAVKVTPGGVVTQYACCSYPAGVAIDQGGNVWLADYGGSSLVALNASGATVLTIVSPNSSLAAEGIAVDGGGRVWAANFRGNSVTEVAGIGGTVLSPTTGFGRDALLDEPRGIAVDAAGNLWISNYGGSTLTQFVGLASPVKTPLLGPPVVP